MTLSRVNLPRITRPLELGTLDGYEQRIPVLVTERSARLKGDRKPLPENKFKTYAFFTWNGEQDLTGTLNVLIPERSDGVVNQAEIPLQFKLKLSLSTDSQP